MHNIDRHAGARGQRPPERARMFRPRDRVEHPREGVRKAARAARSPNAAGDATVVSPAPVGPRAAGGRSGSAATLEAARPRPSAGGVAPKRAFEVPRQQLTGSIASPHVVAAVVAIWAPPPTLAPTNATFPAFTRCPLATRSAGAATTRRLDGEPPSFCRCVTTPPNCAPCTLLTHPRPTGAILSWCPTNSPPPSSNAAPRCGELRGGPPPSRSAWRAARGGSSGRSSGTGPGTSTTGCCSPPAGWPVSSPSTPLGSRSRRSDPASPRWRSCSAAPARDCSSAPRSTVGWHGESRRRCGVIPTPPTRSPPQA